MASATRRAASSKARCPLLSFIRVRWVTPPSSMKNQTVTVPGLTAGNHVVTLIMRKGHSTAQFSVAVDLAVTAGSNATTVDVDVLPWSCHNVYNTRAWGRVPVVIPGPADVINATRRPRSPPE